MTPDVCALCLESKKLVSSHLIPQAIYDFCRTKDSEPIFMSAKVVMPSSRQAQHPLLCRACEEALNKEGENWLVPRLATMDKKFPLLDLLEHNQPDVKPDIEGDLTAYVAARNPAIEINKIIHFAMGVFWKASIHSWEGGKSDPRIELGPYGE